MTCFTFCTKFYGNWPKNIEILEGGGGHNVSPPPPLGPGRPQNSLGLIGFKKKKNIFSYYPILHRYMKDWMKQWMKESKKEWMKNWNRYKSLYRPWWLPRWLLPKFVMKKWRHVTLPHPIIPCLDLHITWHTSGLPGSYFHFLFHYH